MTRKRLIAFIILLIVNLPVWGGENRQQADTLNFILRSEFIPMKDGVLLATDVYLPWETGKFPCILVRTPYNKQHVKGEAERMTEYGYAVVAQDCRGKFLSEDEFYPLKNEREDGLTTVDWIRSQSWSNGKIGGWGGSYVGYTQWAISDVLDVITPELTSANMYELLYPGGLFSLATAFNWGIVVDAKTVNPVPPEKILASYSILPLSVADDSTFKDVEFIDDWLTHTTYDEYWQAMNHRGRTDSPVLSIAGWYDIFLMPQIKDFLTLEQKAHADSRLIIGPWCHGSQAFKNEYGGSDRTGHRKKLIRRFLNKHLKGIDIDFSDMVFKDRKYNLFIIERNEYYGSDVWPPKETVFTEYYIGSDCYFSPEIPDTGGKLEYRYDPLNPYPNKGGTFLGVGVGPALQNDNISRSDQLIFETSALQSPLILLGPISATLYVSSNVSSTDFIVCLQDVFPEGNIINIQEGGRSVNLKTGINKIELSVWGTGYQLNPEHKLRAVVTSSWFPRFNRSLNSGEPIFSATTVQVAEQSVYFGNYPSSVTLPILNLSE